MKPYKKILVMGAGAVGGYYGGRINEHTDSEVTFIARGAHLKALKEKRLTIKSPDGNLSTKVRALAEPRKADKPDLILFTVKSYDTESAARQIIPIVSSDTQILTIQNGIENYRKLVGFFGEDRVLQGFCKIEVGVPEPGLVSHKSFGKVTVGEQDGSESKRLKAVKELFEDAEIPISISSEIQREVWLKFTWNCLFNMLTAAAGVTVDKLFESEEGEKLCYNLYREIQKVAEREGITLSDENGKKIIESTKKLEGFETSTYQDRKKGKKMEFQAFTGAVVRLARRHALEVPYHEMLYGLLILIDKKF